MVATDIYAIVVLRGGSDLSRIVQGVIAFKDYCPSLFVLSGYPCDEIIRFPEKDVWKMHAIALGVPEEQIRIEYNSKNTKEHPLELIKMEDIDEDSKIRIVTSKWHMPRALDVFKKTFSNISPIPVQYNYKNLDYIECPWFPQADAFNWSCIIIREYSAPLLYSIYKQKDVISS